MTGIPFFSEDDAERMAWSSWLWDVDHDLAQGSWEHVKDVYRERAEFIVEFLNETVGAA
jgi:hypothetical protein